MFIADVRIASKRTIVNHGNHGNRKELRVDLGSQTSCRSTLHSRLRLRGAFAVEGSAADWRGMPVDKQACHFAAGVPVSRRLELRACGCGICFASRDDFDWCVEGFGGLLPRVGCRLVVLARWCCITRQVGFAKLWSGQHEASGSRITPRSWVPVRRVAISYGPDWRLRGIGVRPKFNWCDTYLQRRWIVRCFRNVASVLEPT